VAACVTAFVLAAGAMTAPAARAAVACPVVPYPGDAAAREAIAGWMAGGATAAGLPGELPVMAALVESSLQNLPAGTPGAGDSVGYFQMRTSIWDSGAYAGFATQPDLQLRWFTDTAAQVRAARIARGAPDPAADETAWGEWIADVERPAAQYRGRYQLRLAEARALLAACGVAGVPTPPGPVPVAPGGGGMPPGAGAVPPSAGGVPGAASPGTTGAAPPGTTGAAPPGTTPGTGGPALRVGGASRQRPLARRAILVGVRCPSQRCTANATVTLSLPGAAQPLRLFAKPVRLSAGRLGSLRIALGASARTALQRALRTRSPLRATVRVTVAGDDGRRTTRTRSVTIVG
jgi:hypothetical protein